MIELILRLCINQNPNHLGHYRIINYTSKIIQSLFFYIQGFYHLCPPISYHTNKMTSKSHFGVNNIKSMQCPTDDNIATRITKKTVLLMLNTLVGSSKLTARNSV